MKRREMLETGSAKNRKDLFVTPTSLFEGARWAKGLCRTPPVTTKGWEENSTVGGSFSSGLMSVHTHVEAVFHDHSPATCWDEAPCQTPWSSYMGYLWAGSRTLPSLPSAFWGSPCPLSLYASAGNINSHIQVKLARQTICCLNHLSQVLMGGFFKFRSWNSLIHLNFQENPK